MGAKGQVISLRSVAAAIFAGGVLAVVAVVVPKEPDTASGPQRESALADCNVIASAMSHYRADTGFKPCGFQGNGSYGWLRGAGAEPTFEHHPGGWVGNLSWFLEKNFMADQRWAGPYVRDLRPDPWGRQYVVITEALWHETAKNRLWVLSAGPDGVIQTDPRDTVAVGDDVGIVIR